MKYQFNYQYTRRSFALWILCLNKNIYYTKKLFKTQSSCISVDRQKIVARIKDALNFSVL